MALALTIPLLGSGRSAALDRVDGYVNLTYGHGDQQGPAGTVHRDDATQLVDGVFGAAFSDTTRYRLGLRSTATEGWMSGGERSGSTRAQTVEPRAELEWVAPPWTADLAYRRVEALAQSSLAPDTRIGTDDYRARLAWAPERLPRLGFQLDRIDARDELRGLMDTTLTRYLGTADYGFEDLALHYSLTQQLSADELAGTDREQRTHVASAGYGRSFLDGALRLDASYTFTDDRARDSFAQPGATVDALRASVRGLAGTPADPGRGTLGDRPELRDGGLLDRAIEIGQAGRPFPEVGLELLVRSRVERLRLSIAVDPTTGPAELSQLEAAVFRFDIYASELGLDWTLVGSAAPAYDPARGRFELAVPGAPEVKFVKAVVAANGTGRPVWVAEVEAVASELAGRHRDAASRAHTGSFAVTARPTDRLTLAASFTGTDATQEPLSLESFTGSFAGTAGYLVARDLVEASGGYQRTFTRFAGPLEVPDTFTETFSAGLTATPLRTLQAALTGTRTEAAEGGSRTQRAHAVSTHIGAEVYADVQVGLDGHWGVAQDFREERRTTTWGGAASASSRLRKDLTATFSFAGGLQDATAGITAPKSLVDAYRSSLFVSYLPTRFLGLGTRLELADTDGALAFLHEYRADVLPLEKVALFASLQRAEREERAPTTTFNASARWSATARINLTASFLISHDATGGESDAAFVSVNYRF